MVELARHQNKCDNITFHIDIAPADLIVYADENLISQVVINLLKNAIQAIDAQADGKIEIKGRCNAAEEILIEIKNNGPCHSFRYSRSYIHSFFYHQRRR